MELSVDREVLDRVGRPRTVRLSARFEVARDGGDGPSPGEIAEALSALDGELERGAAAAGFRLPTARPDRPLEELVETYRPRQPELIEALFADGELSEHEAELLRGALGHRPGPVRPIAGDPAAPPVGSLAAMPLANDRPSASARPVPELLAQYQITTLKQAGAVRARRQISFDEYMALKRHFAEGAGRTASSPSTSADPA